jgi:hypothetical protein
LIAGPRPYDAGPHTYVYGVAGLNHNATKASWVVPTTHWNFRLTTPKSLHFMFPNGPNGHYRITAVNDGGTWYIAMNISM